MSRANSLSMATMDACFDKKIVTTNSASDARKICDTPMISRTRFSLATSLDIGAVPDLTVPHGFLRAYAILIHVRRRPG
jgi:hypothetical protein